jgi:5'-3' exoribonuclease 1
MLVGNDFLPHCPHLEIQNGALSLMLNNYIDLLPEWGGYLTSKEKIHLERFEQFMYHIAVFEEEHFKRRAYEENEPGWKLSSENETEEDDFYGKYFGDTPTPSVATVAHTEEGALKYGSRNNVENKLTKNASGASRSYRDFYYETKLGWSPSKENRDETLTYRRAHVRDYMEGLQWVLYYYHKGCPSFSWYFPHLYSPLSTDMVNLGEFYNDSDNVSKDEDGFEAFLFEETEPFPSLAQLLSVLPPQSANLLPKSLGELMTYPSSPLIEFYPNEFTTDANGKRQSWEAVVQIPFIDGDQLLEVVNSVIDTKDQLSAAEKKRNERGESVCFVPEREEGATEAIYPPIKETARRMSDNKRGGRGGGRGRGRGGRRGGRGGGRGRGRG